MSERPAAVRLDDLAEPRFTPEVDAVFGAMADMSQAIELDAASLLAAAREQTGLDDFGPDNGFRERFDVYLHALRTEAQLSDAGRLVVHTQLLQMLTGRLLVHDYAARHPDVVDIPITAPIVIVGLPRTGTTHLHNLMAADPALRSLPYWESVEPVPPLAEQASPPASVDADPRRERIGAGLWLLDEAMPHFKRMHEMTTDHVHEEIQLLALDCNTMLMETTACMPSWREYYTTHDCTSSYEYLRRVLQVLSHQRGAGKRWVLKSPQHLEQIGPLLSAFPDAVVVFTHRDPAAVVISFVTMGAYGLRMNHAAPIDLHAYGAYWRSRILDLYAAAVRDRDLVAADRSVDVRFDDFMADEQGTVAAIYSTAGQPFDAPARAAMAAFVAAHPRGRHGTVEYEFDQFGLDPQEIRRAAGFYVDRFGISFESRW